MQTEEQVIWDIREHAVRFNKISLNGLLHLENGDKVTEKRSDCEHSARRFLTDTKEPEDEDGVEETQSLSEDLKYIAAVTKILEKVYWGVRKVIVECHYELRLQKQSQLRQTTLFDQLRKQ